MGYNIILIFLSVIFLISSFLCGAVAYHRRVLRYLHYLQQDDYSPEKFIKWYNLKPFDKKVILIFVIYLPLFLYAFCMLVCIALFQHYTSEAISLFVLLSTIIVLTSYLLIIYIFIRKEEDLSKKTKSSLFATNREKQIYYLTLFISLLFIIGFAFFMTDNRSFVVLFVFSYILDFAFIHDWIPLFLPFSVFILSKFEKLKQK